MWFNQEQYLRLDKLGDVAEDLKKQKKENM